MDYRNELLLNRLDHHFEGDPTVALTDEEAAVWQRQAFMSNVPPIPMFRSTDTADYESNGHARRKKRFDSVSAISEQDERGHPILKLYVNGTQCHAHAVLNGRVIEDSGALGLIQKSVAPLPQVPDPEPPSVSDHPKRIGDYCGVPVSGRNTTLKMRGKAGDHQLLRHMDIKRSAT